MANRLKALFMLLVVGLVLPVAGSPQRFCTRAMTFLSSGERCCGCAEKDCSDCPDDSEPTKPSCVTTPDVLPDGVNPEQIALPQLVAVPISPFTLPEPVEIVLPAIESVMNRDRAPPDPDTPLYISPRSLLL
jgi:hypothetical protein